MADEAIVIVPIELMDDDNFLTHFEFRHASELPGLNSFVEPTHPDTIRSYRIFHETIHRLFPHKVLHEHDAG
jgi:hypothetical protein